MAAIKSHVWAHLIEKKVQPILESSSILNGNRVYAFGGDAWAVQYPRAYTQPTVQGIMLGNQPRGNVQCNGSITAGLLEADTMTRAGVGSSNTNRKVRIYAEGSLSIMEDTCVNGDVVADSFVTPPDGQTQDNIATIENKLCLDGVKSVDVKEYIRKDSGDQKRIGIIAQ